MVAACQPCPLSLSNKRFTFKRVHTGYQQALKNDNKHSITIVKGGLNIANIANTHKDIQTMKNRVCSCHNQTHVQFLMCVSKSPACLAFVSVGTGSSLTGGLVVSLGWQRSLMWAFRRIGRKAAHKRILSPRKECVDRPTPLRPGTCPLASVNNLVINQLHRPLCCWCMHTFMFLYDYSFCMAALSF